MDATLPPRLRAVLCGRVAALGDVRSGIDKRLVTGPHAVGPLGLAGDEQADLRVHGGPDKAVHVYAWSHYGFWRERWPQNPLLDRPGAFGENFSVEGMDEHTVCLGDEWRVGTARLVVAQGRQPCFKLNLRFGVADMAQQVQNSLRAGWYLRVLEPGRVTAGDAIELIERPHPARTIASLLALIRDGVTDAAALAPVLSLPLPASWRKLFERRTSSGVVEDSTHRLTGRA